ncbi:MAG: class I SAM-dependent methyltransferase [Chloroflexi bacterium]|nr:class I SAM-dependent methyltransferase [Chloroflexota bacterium]
MATVCDRTGAAAAKRPSPGHRYRHRRHCPGRFTPAAGHNGRRRRLHHRDDAGGQTGARPPGHPLTTADTLALPFPDATFDAVTSGFLMRNVIDVPGAFREQMRVTKPGGRVVVLESSPPKDNLFKPFIRIHLNYVIPTLGRLISGNADAYKYLPDSTQAFKGPAELADICAKPGLPMWATNCSCLARLPFTSAQNLLNHYLRTAQPHTVIIKAMKKWPFCFIALFMFLDGLRPNGG